MKTQVSFYELRWPKARSTRLQSILNQLERVVDWRAFLSDAVAHHPPAGNGRQPVPLETMLRMHTVAWLTGANDRQLEELLIDSPSVCAFCRLDDTASRPPDAETYGNFRRRLARAGLENILQKHIESVLARRGVSIVPGQIHDARWLGPLL